MKAAPPDAEFLCIWLPAFRLQAAAKGYPQGAAVAVERQGPLEVVAEASRAARALGIHPGMTYMQALGRAAAQPSGGGLARHDCSPAAETAAAGRLLALAETTSPRVQALSPGLCVLDFAGLQRLHGGTEQAARRMREAWAANRGRLVTGVAASPALAVLAARGRLRNIATGEERLRLGPLPIELLAALEELTRAQVRAEEIPAMLDLLRRWGIATLGGLAALPPAALAARLGQSGLFLQRLARGEVAGLLNPPADVSARLEEEIPFDPPLANREQLTAALRPCWETIARQLEARDRAVERVTLRLTLEAVPPCAYAHAFTLPARSARDLAAQLQLALERQPPPARIEAARLICELARPRRIQARLFAVTPPDAARLPQLLTRLRGLFRQLGSPRLLDGHAPRGFGLEEFAPPAELAAGLPPAAPPPRLALRLYRPPRELQPAPIQRRAGPWRSTGPWWKEGQDWDEWDTEMKGGVYRIGRERATGRVYILGRYD